MSHPRCLAIARTYGIQLDLTSKREATISDGKNKIDILAIQHISTPDLNSCAGSAFPASTAVDSSPNYFSLPAIERSDRWVITDTLQESLFGIVKLAFDHELNAQVAIKISRRELSDEQHSRSGASVSENVKREAAIMRYLKARAGPLAKRHQSNAKEIDMVQPVETESMMAGMEGADAEAPSSVEGEMDGSRYVAQLVEELEDEYFHYLITEFVRRGDIYSLLTSRPLHRLNEDQARFFFTQLVFGVKYLHDRNVAHLDLSLENICLDVDDSIRIIDFGVAAIHPLTPIKYTSQYLIHSSSSSTNLCGINANPSNSCSFLCEPIQELRNKPGKLRYMSPELLCNLPWDAFKNDIFALGVILFALLTGRPAFERAEIGDPWFNAMYSGLWLTPVIMNQPAARSFSHLSAEAKDLIDTIIKPQEQRPSCELILNHRWLMKKA